MFNSGLIETPSLGILLNGILIYIKNLPKIQGMDL